MFTKKIFMAVLLIIVSANFAFALTADDFLPVVQAPDEQKAELSAVKNPDAVEIKEDLVFGTVINAETAQDAINKILASQVDGGGAAFAHPTGGYGLVATGVGVYDKNMSNITAKRIAQRNAYVEALMQAKNSMAEMLRGAAVRGQTRIENEQGLINTADLPLVNADMALNERLSTSVAAVLKGYVVYNVKDDFEKGRVLVTIVSTPKTRSELKRPTENTLAAPTLQAALDAVLVEIQNNLVAPVGGRIITVPETGEIGFVGFGSAVVQYHENAALSQRLALNAERIAELRAADALNSIITGEHITSETNLDANTSSQMHEYETIIKRDPVSGLTTEQDAAFADGLRSSFQNKEEFRQVISSCRQGILPPGVMRRKWIDKDNAFAWGFALYIPSLSGKIKNIDVPEPENIKNKNLKNNNHDKNPELKQGKTGTITGQNL